jgi:hypothetical protein
MNGGAVSDFTFSKDQAEVFDKQTGKDGNSPAG